MSQNRQQTDAWQQCTGAVMKMAMFSVEDGSGKKDADLVEVISQRQISYFGDWNEIDAFLKHIGKGNPWYSKLDSRELQQEASTEAVGK
jgi:hypothetical protein